MSTDILGSLLEIPIQDTIPLLKDFRTRLMPVAEQKLMDAACGSLVDLALSKVDSELCELVQFPPGSNGHSSESSPRLWAWDYVNQWARYSEQTDLAMEVRNDCYIEVTLALFPYGGHTLLIPYGDCDMIRLLCDFPELKDFSYWNNTDRPENVSEQEWNIRKSAWDQVNVPEKDGFLYRLLNIRQIPGRLPTASDLEQYLEKSRESIIRDRAGKWLTKELFQEMQRDAQDGVSMVALSVAAFQDVIQHRESNSERWQFAIWKWEQLVRSAEDYLKLIMLKEGESNHEGN